MTVTEALEQLAGAELIFLSRWFLGIGTGTAAVYQGKLSQAPDGDWHFLHNAPDSSGLVGVDLGSVDGPLTWSVEGEDVQITHTLIETGDPAEGSPRLLLDVIQLGKKAMVGEPFSA
jgi:hypothetical protein